MLFFLGKRGKRRGFQTIGTYRAECSEEARRDVEIYRLRFSKPASSILGTYCVDGDPGRPSCS